MEHTPITGPDAGPLAVKRNLTRLRQILRSLPVTLIPTLDEVSRPALAEGRLALKTEG